MSIIPKGKNNLDSFSLFEERKVYRDNIYPPKEFVPSPIDLWYEKPLYGKIDNFGNSIFVDDRFVKKLDSIEGNVFAMNFVADAFKDLKEYYAIAANTNRLITEGSKLVTLNPKTGWSSTNKQHVDYMKQIYQSFAGAYMSKPSRKTKLLNFDSFLGFFDDFVNKLISSSFTFTKTGFITTSYCASITSGLMIEIDDDDCGDDEIKYENYINDPNFIFYTIAAQRYGFKIDKNVPWRLVADLASPVMRKYMSNYPEPPPIDRPFRSLYYIGDVVEITDLRFDPAIPSTLQFVVKEVIRESDQVVRLMLVLVNDPGKLTTSDSRVLTKILKDGIPTNALEYDGKIAIKNLDGPNQGEGRKNIENLISNYQTEIQNYLKKPKLSLDNIFELMYYKSYRYDLRLLKVYVLEFYNSFVLGNPTVNFMGVTNKNQTVQETFLRKRITMEEMEDKYDDSYWIKMYARIRIKELGLNLSDYKIKELMERSSVIQKVNGTPQALEYINQNLNGAIEPKIKLTPRDKDAKIENVDILNDLYYGEVNT